MTQNQNVNKLKEIFLFECACAQLSESSFLNLQNIAKTAMQLIEAGVESEHTLMLAQEDMFPGTIDYNQKLIITLALQELDMKMPSAEEAKKICNDFFNSQSNNFYIGSIISSFLHIPLDKLEEIKQWDDDKIFDYIGNEIEKDSSKVIDIDKFGTVVHMILWEVGFNLIMEPVSYAVFGKTAITKKAFEYGPIQILYPEEVRTIAQMLQCVTESVFKSNFKIENSEQYGLNIKNGSDIEKSELLDYSWRSFCVLREYYIEASKISHAMLAWY